MVEEDRSQIPEELVKVFTKYDVPFDKINVPILKNLVARPMSETFFPELLDTDVVKYINVGYTEGLEGVRFYHYKRQPQTKEEEP